VKVPTLFKFVAHVVATALCLALPAAAQDVSQVSLLPGWQMENGNRMLGVRIALAPGWKTYWRATGGNGIPPQFDWSASGNVAAAQVHWPSPAVIETYGSKTAGYSTEVVFPLEVTPRDAGQPLDLDLSLTYGVCEEICMPAEARLRSPLPPEQRGEVSAVSAALKTGSLRGASAGIDHACRIRPEGDQFHLTANVVFPGTAKMPKMVIFETGMDVVWITPRRVETAGHAMTIEADLAYYGQGAFAFDRSRVTINLLGGARAIELSGCPVG
jgi:DsbC/DsbD-like thiol-disulfide interchange protein